MENQVEEQSHLALETHEQPSFSREIMYSSSYHRTRSKHKIEEVSLEKENPFVSFPRNTRKRMVEEARIADKPYVENQNTIEQENSK